MPPSPPPPPTAVAWIADPVRDFLCYSLIELARTALDATFANEAADQAYQRWLTTAAKPKPAGRRGGGRRKAPVAVDGDQVTMFELNTWRRDEDYSVSVRALPNRGEFVVTITEAEFSAEVLAIYDAESQDLITAGIERFDGDGSAAVLVARSFVAMLTDLDDEDDDDTEDEAEEDGGNAAAQVADIADRVAAALAAGRTGETMSVFDEHFLSSTPEALWAIRDGFIAQAKDPRKGGAKTVLAWQTLLEKQLEDIRFLAERKHAWAEAMIDRYQTELLAMAQQPDVDIDTWQALVIALDRAKIAIKPEVRAASLELTSGQAGAPPAEIDIMRSLEEIVEAGGGDAFRIAGHLFDAVTMMPPDFANAAVVLISTAPLPALRDVLPLVLLSPEAACRRAAAAALERMAGEKRLTATGLRRLITLRAWLPEAERSVVDQAVRRARLAGIDCAPWPAGQVRTLQATIIDGSGCQSLLAVAKDGSRHLFAGILIKQDFGVRDVMADRGLARREVEGMLADVGVRVLARPVSRSYLDTAVANALATAGEAGRVPPLALLEVAEILGAADWRAHRLDAQAELARLISALPAPQRTPEGAAASLRQSAGWTDQAELAGSWFEDDETARDLCLRHRRSPKKAIAALLDTVLDARRPVWAERLVWMALWAEAGAGGNGLPHWYDYALVAQALYDQRPLSEIPLMTEIARLTVTRAE